MSEVLNEAASHAECGGDRRRLGGADEDGNSKREAKNVNAQRASASGWPRKATGERSGSGALRSEAEQHRLHLVLGGYSAWFHILPPITRCIVSILVQMVLSYPDAYYFMRMEVDKSSQSGVFERMAFV